MLLNVLCLVLTTEGHRKGDGVGRRLESNQTGKIGWPSTKFFSIPLIKCDLNAANKQTRAKPGAALQTPPSFIQ